MARSDRAISRANRNIQNIAKGINGNMDSLYRSTYMTTSKSNSDLSDLSDKINSSIDKIVTRNMDTIGMPSVSKLYSRISKKDGNNKVVSELEKMFNNGIVSDNLYELFMSNAYLRELDNEIDTVCKYMPKLEEALAVQKDCILSADHFSKDFLNFELPSSGSAATIFSERSKDLKRKYELSKLAEEIYEDTSKYGEKFIYRVPYSVAIGRLLATKPDTSSQSIPTRGLHENAEDISSDETFLFSVNNTATKIFSESGTDMLQESCGTSKSNTDIQSSGASFLKESEGFNIGIEICRSGILESAVNNHKVAFGKKASFTQTSMARLFEQTVLSESEKKEIEASGSIEMPKTKKDKRILSNDGLIGQYDIEPVKVNTLGCVVKKLPRDRVIPIYIDDICMGYYYFELRTNTDADAFMGFKNLLGDPLTNAKGDGKSAFNAVDTTRQDETIKYVAGQLSSFIDKQFVNNNQDLAKEIYMILKYNDLFNSTSIETIKVTFIPPEDMVHFYFRMDPKTHRGISDLDKGIIPAKIYTSLYITSSIGYLTRGQDKRVYYVKQSVDTNIAQTLLNTISQIKQSNFGIRQFQNINNILNITGKFNDFVIPTNASGDPPVQFEIMPGQDIKSPTELMDSLEEMAINSTSIPIEIIQARQSIDYAIQLTMSSSKVLRFCYKRQELFQDQLTELICPIYNYEYNDSVSLTVTLPPPGFINITNTNQLIDNTKGFVQSIVDIDLASEQDETLKAVYFDELFKHYIGTHLDVSTHSKILERCKIKAKTLKDESHTEDDNNQYQSY